MKQKTTQLNPLTIADLKYFFDELRHEFKEELKKYRDENMTRLDEVMGELQTIREDNTIGTYQIRELQKEVDDHETRIRTVEKIQHAQ